MSSREFLDRLRGHEFLPPESILEHVPALYETQDTPLREKGAWIHYFGGPCNWYIFEYDPATEVAFGWADLGDRQNAELGYIDLNELRDLHADHPDGSVLYIERDLDWMPRRFKDI